MSTSALLASSSKVCNNSQEVMVYGFGKFKYLYIAKHLEKLSTKYATSSNMFFQKVHRYEVGKPYEKNSTLKGDISKVEYEDSSHFSNIPRICKSGLVNMVMENYKREQRGEEIIPILFCIDGSNNDTDTPLTP